MTLDFCMFLVNPLECFFSIEGRAALDSYPGPGYNALLLRIIPGYHYSAYSPVLYGMESI